MLLPPFYFWPELTFLESRATHFKKSYSIFSTGSAGLAFVFPRETCWSKTMYANWNGNWISVATLNEFRKKEGVLICEKKVSFSNSSPTSSWQKGEKYNFNSYFLILSAFSKKGKFWNSYETTTAAAQKLGRNKSKHDSWNSTFWCKTWRKENHFAMTQFQYFTVPKQEVRVPLNRKLFNSYCNAY